MRFVWLAVAATACGRIGFDIDPAVQFNDQGSPAANLTCADDRAAPGAWLPTGELAVTATQGGFYAAWTGTTTQPATIVKLDPQLRVVASQTIGAYGPHLNGVLDLGTDVLAAYGNNAYAVVDMLKFTGDLSIMNYFATFAGLAARGPFLANPARSERAYLWSYNNNVVASYMDELGGAGGGSSFAMTGTITETAGDNGTGDSVIVWVEDLGGSSRCSAGNLRFDTPTKPSLVSTRLVSGDCRHARIAAGPSDDAQLVVSTTAGGAVEARYFSAGGVTLHSLSTSGRAPKVRFDGTQFWIAWIDNGVRELRIATIDLAGKLVVADLPGPPVAGDEAFDFVRTGDSVRLVTLGANDLDFVTLCR